VATCSGCAANYDRSIKAWRARCVLNSCEKRVSILLLCFLGAPVEAMMSRLQYLDSAGKGLFDAVVDTDLNPFLCCRRQLTALVLEGSDGPLGVVFCSHPHLHKELMRDIRRMGCDFGGQVHWLVSPGCLFLRGR
jgi:hypothetical protein